MSMTYDVGQMVDYSEGGKLRCGLVTKKPSISDQTRYEINDCSNIERQNILGESSLYRRLKYSLFVEILLRCLMVIWFIASIAFLIIVGGNKITEINAKKYQNFTLGIRVEVVDGFYTGTGGVLCRKEHRLLFFSQEYDARGFLPDQLKVIENWTSPSPSDKAPQYAERTILQSN